MTNPTSNFGWQMPTSTDLVTDLPADFETFGQAVDTSLADLKGGTTGQILSKASNTDMDFTWVANDVGDITAVTAGTGITGGGTSGAVTITNSMATAIDAKGDLISGTGADAFSRLAVGNNGENLVADSSTSTGLRYQGSQSAGKNAVINGGFDIWQRGTTGTANSFSAGAGYNADRWSNAYSGGSLTVTRQATNDTTNLPFVQYCARTQRNSGQTATNTVNMVTTLETADSIRYAGRTVVLSFYARAGANYSSVSNALSGLVYYGTGIDQNLWGFTGIAAAGTTATLTTTWQRFSVAVSIPSNTTEIGLLFGYTPTGTAGANDWFELTGVQLETGSAATQFSRAGGTIQGELAACQRYYYRSTPGAAFSTFGMGLGKSTTVAACPINLAVTMRVVPTAVEASLLTVFDGASTYDATAVALSGSLSPSRNIGEIEITVASGLTQFRPYIVTNSNSASFLAFNAEL